MPVTHRQAACLHVNTDSSREQAARARFGRRKPSAIAACLALSLAPSLSRAEYTWPDDQLLPTFPAPAPTQDLIILRGASTTWQAEGSLGHATGRLDGDGWLCQVGVDQPGHMVYGPYVTNLPFGGNTARFRMKIDNNSANDAHQATIDVRDNTSGTTLASKDITRTQFTVAGDWVDFALPFSIPATGHAIELRVHWAGGAYLKVDSVSVDRGSEDELYLFASLKGVVNASEPRIFSYEGDAHAEGKHTWLQSLGLAWTEHTDNWSLINKYRSEIEGLIVYDETQPDTVNLATTLAGPAKALVASPSLLSRLMGPPYNLPILEDLRGRFNNKLAVYQHMYDELWPSLTHRVIMGVSPHHHKAAVREYASALGAAAIWLDPMVSGESEMLDKFLSSMGPGSAYMGWWPDEGPGVERGSRHGIATVASDYATNLTLHSGMPRTVRVKPIPAKPVLENKLYVAFILSDGDNLQYVEHLMRKLWNDGARGQVPIGWTVSPAMLDAMPGALDFYYTSGTDNDNLISGPSGWGYGYPNSWPSQPLLDRFAAETDDYARRSGLRVVTVWNTIVGGIDADVGNSFAAHAPSVLGLTAQNTGGGLTVYDGKLPGFALSCNYCTNEQAIKDHIASAAAGWDGESPRFILIQAQPWQGVTPTTFLNVKNSLNGDYAVIRPDNWFQLLRQANGIAIEPIQPIVDGIYRLINKSSGKCVATDGASVVQQACADDDAQRWHVTSTSSGYTKIAALADETKVFDVTGGDAATGEGPQVVVSTASGADSQQWQPVWESERFHHLIARHSDRCLDVPSGRSDDGLALQQWTCNGASAQAFRFADPIWPPPVEEPDGGVAGDDGGAPGADGGASLADAGGPWPGDSGAATRDGGPTGPGGDGGAPTDVLPGAGCACNMAANAGVDASQLLGPGLVMLLGRMRRSRRARASKQ
jgi:hypothetical protein